MKRFFSVRFSAVLLLAVLLWVLVGCPLIADEWTDVPSRAGRLMRQLPVRAKEVLRYWLTGRAQGDPAVAEAGYALRVWDSARSQTLTMSLEDYVPGVIAAEMPLSYCPEALKCQAVAARTRAVWSSRQAGGNGCRTHPDCDLCTDSACCQGWLSTEAQQARWGSEAALLSGRAQAAAQATCGQILTYGGLPIEMLYHACSGGATEDAQAVFSSGVPYLVSVPSPGEESFSSFRSEARFTRAEAASLLAEAFPGCGVTAETLPGLLELLSTTSSGRVREARLGSVTVSGNELRQALGLKSALFTWEADDETITFHVRGYGHGVGLSQAGAQAMASTGADFRQILSHYYPGTVLTQLPGRA